MYVLDRFMFVWVVCAYLGESTKLKPNQPIYCDLESAERDAHELNKKYLTELCA